MAIFKSLTFDGINSLDYGIYITGEAVYNAPQRAVEMVTIPGRNGTLAIDQGRFENIEVTYKAGCFADNQTDFASKVSAFRNVLASRYAYVKLTDEYHPDEYRLGLYKDGLEVEAVSYHRAGEFDITFDCKPQRFLTSGDTALTADDWNIIGTETGDIASIDNHEGVYGIKSLTVSLGPIQDTSSGVPSPTNICPISGHTEVKTYRTGVNVWDEEWEAGGLVNATSDATTYENDISINYPSTDTEYHAYQGETYTTSLGQTVYGGTLDVVSGELVVDRAMVDLGSLWWTYTTVATSNYFRSTALSGAKSVAGGQTSAICSDFETYVGAQAGFVSADSVAWVAPTNVSSNPYACIKDSRYTNATDFKQAMNGVQLCYELATPQTYQLTPEQITLLTGDNYIWSDGQVEVVYGTEPWYNPTPFEAKPLIQATGTGTITINDIEVSISASPTTIDCEAMEAYNGTESRNGNIVLTPNEFPTLKSGNNVVEAGSGITALEITPRWWKI